MTRVAGELTDAELYGFLERDYRRLLRWYPRWWRAEHGDALVGTLLDDAEASDRFTVRRGERFGFVSAGLAARLDRVVMQPVRDAAATVMLAMGTGIALAMFVFWSWAPWRAGDGGWVASFGPFSDVGPVIAGMWVVAFVAASVRRWWVGRVVLLVTVAGSWMLPFLQARIAPPAAFVQPPQVVAFLSACAVIAILGTPRTGAPLLGATVGWAALGGAVLGLMPVVSGQTGEAGIPPFMYLFQPSGASTVIAASLLLCVVLAARGRWAPAFLLVMTVVPLTAGTDSGVIVSILGLDGWAWPPLLVSVPVVAGLVVLVLASQRRVLLPGMRAPRPERPNAGS